MTARKGPRGLGPFRGPRPGEKGSRSLRALEILETVAALDRPATAMDIVAGAGLPKATVHRLCALLESHGYLRRDLSGRGLVSGPRLQDLTQSLLAAEGQRSHRHAVLASVARRIGETCNLAVPSGSEMVYFDRVEAEWPLRLQLPIGTRVPLYCTAAGKLYLSSLGRERREAVLRSLTLERRTPNTITDLEALNRELDRIRETGVGTDNEEFLESMVAVAVPVTDREGRLFATLSFHAPVLRMTLEEAKTHIPVLREAARELARAEGLISPGG